MSTRGDETMPALGEEAAALLQSLIRLNTVNPPGGERPAQELLAGRLSEAGFECELLGAEESRPNLVARLKGAQDGPTLCLLSHTDTVLADPSEWSHDPWSGDLADGFIWGRGALDMKSQTAAETAAAASLGRSGWRPAKGDLIVVAVVDEETGGELGAQWITKHHPEKVRCDMLINEGGGQSFEYRGRRRYGVCCAEKGVFRFTITTRGVAAHASMPKLGDNALLKIAPLLARIASRSPSYSSTPEARALLEGLGESPDDLAGAARAIEADDPRLVPLLEPILGVTLTPTKISASEKINVIPSSAEVRVDCRVPPGLGEAEVRAAISEVLGEEGSGAGEAGAGLSEGLPAFEIKFTEKVPGNSSPAYSPLMDAIEEWVSQNDEGASVVPTTMPGFTDSRHFRAAFPECVAYGFFPQRHQGLLEGMPLMHGANERIDVRDLTFAAQSYADLARRLLGSA